MPTYEYACKDCGEHLEVVQSFKDEPLTECPNCQGNLRKVFSPIGIAFKGDGFYKTDNRSSSKAGSSSSSDGASKSDTKTDTKTESSGSSTSSSGSPSSSSDGASKSEAKSA
jgi:putative FmdB family regulatory protein